MCAACWLHAAYLFSAAWLTLAYLGTLFFERLNLKKTGLRSAVQAAREPFMLGLLALVLVAPLVWYNQAIMSSTAPELAERALDIIVNIRIPHHSLPERWLTPTAYMQIGLVILALILVWKSRLFVILLVPALGGLVFTLIQISTGDNSLALLAPWRVSVFLVPLASAIILGRLLSWLISIPGIKWQSSISQIVLVSLATGLVLFAVRGGMAIQITRNNRYAKQENRPLMNYVKDTLTAGQLYLVPPQDNKFDEFRLYTGAPIFINWKSHPYRDYEVLEWYERNLRAYDFYTADNACQILAEIRADYPITHYVSDLSTPRPACSGWEAAYADNKFELYASTDQP